MFYNTLHDIYTKKQDIWEHFMFSYMVLTFSEYLLQNFLGSKLTVI